MPIFGASAVPISGCESQAGPLDALDHEGLIGAFEDSSFNPSRSKIWNNVGVKASANRRSSSVGSCSADSESPASATRAFGIEFVESSEPGFPRVHRAVHSAAHVSHKCKADILEDVKRAMAALALVSIAACRRDADRGWRRS